MYSGLHRQHFNPPTVLLSDALQILPWQFPPPSLSSPLPWPAVDVCSAEDLWWVRPLCPPPEINTAGLFFISPDPSVCFVTHVQLRRSLRNLTKAAQHYRCEEKCAYCPFKKFKQRLVDVLSWVSCLSFLKVTLWPCPKRPLHVWELMRPPEGEFAFLN